MNSFDQILTTFTISEEELNQKLKKFGVSVSQLLTLDKKLHEATSNLLAEFLSAGDILSREQKLNFQFRFHKSKLQKPAPSILTKTRGGERTLFGFIQSIHKDRAKPCFKIFLAENLNEILELSEPQKTITIGFEDRIDEFEYGAIVSVEINPSEPLNEKAVQQRLHNCFIVREHGHPTEVLFLETGTVLSGFGNTNSIGNTGFYQLQLSKQFKADKKKEVKAYFHNPNPIIEFQPLVGQISGFIITSLKNSPLITGLPFELLKQIARKFAEPLRNQLVSNIFKGIEKQSIWWFKASIPRLEKLGFSIPTEEISQTFNGLSAFLWLEEKISGFSKDIPLSDWVTFITDLDIDNLIKAIRLALSQGFPAEYLTGIASTFVDRRFTCLNEVDVQLVSELMAVVHHFSPEQKLASTQIQTDKSWPLVQLWLNGCLNETEDQWFIDAVKEYLTIAEKKKFLTTLPDEKQWLCLLEDDSLAEELLAKMKVRAVDFLSGISFLALDLESNRHTISELAWISNTGPVSYKGHKSISEQGLQHLQNAIGESTTLIGHNIEAFDLPVLESFGFVSEGINFWDTLKFEYILNPTRKSFALNGSHTALKDAEISKKLFENQILRFISCNEAVYDLASEFIPVCLLDGIEKERQYPFWKRSSTQSLEETSEMHFRPIGIQPKAPSSLLNFIAENIHNEPIILAPRLLWGLLTPISQLTFYDLDSDYSLLLNELAFETTFSEKPFELAVCKSLLSRKSNPADYIRWIDIPAAIRAFFGFESKEVLTFRTEFEWKSTRAICLDPSSPNAIELLNQFPTHPILFLGRDLLEQNSKIVLKDLDFPELFRVLENDPIWIQISSGIRSIQLNQSQISALQITIPERAKQVWMNKLANGRFEICCNMSFQLDEVQNPERIQESSITDSALIQKESVSIVRPDKQHSKYPASDKRVNPESPNRMLYWTYQFKMLKGVKGQEPIVWLIQNPEEVLGIEAVARQEGYYIPDGASLSRRLELLHQSQKPKKLIVLPFVKWEKVLENNYLSSINFVWDSFVLDELFIRGSSETIPEGDKTLEMRDEENIKTSPFNTFSLLNEKQRPLVEYMALRVIQNHPDNKILLMDPRLEDPDEHFSLWNTVSLYSEMWSTEEAYKSDYELFRPHFRGGRPEEALDLNLEKAKAILEHIFVKSAGHSGWRSEQVPYLDKILPAKTDLLITLPTGGGKSVLFQGPALFRSAFTGRLNIVITPLIGLMQDQVDYLQREKGFYSNVDYLGGGKSYAESKNLIRKIVGGEITLLYITPERFRSRAFEKALLTRLDSDQGFEYIIYDEAHCISQWGQDFRPDYLNAGRCITKFRKNLNLSGTTLLFSATISEQVFSQLKKVLE